MTLGKRIGCAALAFAVAATIQFQLVRLVAGIHHAPEKRTAVRLDELPRQIGLWRSVEHVVPPELKFADEQVLRTYQHRRSGQPAIVWIGYSKNGRDRGHHPEVCMRVAGRPEDRAQRQPLDAPGDAAAIQQYRFGHPGDFQWVYYWHYTLPMKESEDLGTLQRAYLRLRARPASVTIEVIAAELPGTDRWEIIELARTLDGEIQRLLPAGSVRGSERDTVVVQQ